MAAGGGGAEATTRLASAGPIEGTSTSSDRDREASGGDDVVDDAAAVESSQDGSHNRRRRRPLMPGHRAALKRAVSALWEPSTGGGGRVGGRRRNGGEGGQGERGQDDGERREGEQTHGGLRASELSAAIYGVQQRDASCHEGGGNNTGGHESHRDAGDPDSEAEEEGERAWDQGVGCTREDFEEVLLELEAEEKNAQ